MARGKQVVSGVQASESSLNVPSFGDPAWAQVGALTRLGGGAGPEMRVARHPLRDNVAGWVAGDSVFPFFVSK